MRLTSSEDGSIPLALLAAIVTAGLITVLVGTALQAQQTVRFDRAFTNVIQVADAGIQDVYRRLNYGPKDEEALHGLNVGESLDGSTSLNGMQATWTAERTTAREFLVSATGTAEDGTKRTVTVEVQEESLFFPGAFGDRLVALNGNSTQVDSYESRTPVGSCSSATDPASTCWGTDDEFGTRKGALGTNENFDFSGVSSVLRAVLYDWADNPGQGATEENPGGDRCSGGLCTAEVLRIEQDRLDYATDEQMQFVYDKLDDCDGRWLGETAAEQADDVVGNNGEVKVGSKKDDAVLRPQNPAHVDANATPADASWDNYYCAESLQFLGDTTLDGVDFDSATGRPHNPVVIFVRDSVSVAGHTNVNCPDCPNNMNDADKWRSVRPRAGGLQIYVATDEDSKGGDVQVDQHAIYAGVLFAPRASCGASGNAGAHIYGSMICGRVDNVGNWHFHFDEQLVDFGRGTYGIASWREELPDDTP